MDLKGACCFYVFIIEQLSILLIHYLCTKAANSGDNRVIIGNLESNMAYKSTVVQKHGIIQSKYCSKSQKVTSKLTVNNVSEALQSTRKILSQGKRVSIHNTTT